MLFKLHGVDLMLIYDKYLYYWTTYGSKNKTYHWRKKKVSLDTKNYLTTTINYRKFRFHRVVYFAHNRNFDIFDDNPDNQIDHIDGNKLNNHIFNLRVVNNSQNMRNTNRYKNAKGYTKTASGRFRAIVRINGKDERLGTFDTEEEAHEVYLKKRNELHNDFIV